MKRPIISIIIPAYNCERFIERCVYSLLKQSFQDFEIVAINDGSTDDTLRVLREIDDSHLRVYTQKNQGPAKTRNRGIDLARGEYLMFVDSDDYVKGEYLQVYYNVAKAEYYDLIMGGYTKIKDGKVNFRRKLSQGSFAPYVITAPYAKLYRTDFIRVNHIEFLDTNVSEDVYFNVLAYSKNPKIKIIDNTDYCYCYNSVSISNTTHIGLQKKVDVLGFAQKLLEINGIDEDIKEYFIIRYLVSHLLTSGRMASSQSFVSEEEKYFSWIEKNFPRYQKNKNLSIFGPVGGAPQLELIIYLFVFLQRMHLTGLFAKFYCRG